MSIIGSPSIIFFTRNSTTNGAITYYDFTVKIDNYYQDSDVITVTAPSTV